MVIQLLTSYFFSRFAENQIRRIGLLSLIGVVVSVAALLVVMGVMNDLNMRVKSRLLDHEPHLVISMAKDSHFSESALQESLKAHENSEWIKLSRGDVIVWSWKGEIQGAILVQLNFKDWQVFAKRLLRRVPFSSTSQGSKILLSSSGLSQVLGLLPGDHLRWAWTRDLIRSLDTHPPLLESRVTDWVQFKSVDWDRAVLVQIHDEFAQDQNLMLDREFEYFVWLHDPWLADEVKRNLSKREGIGKIETWADRNSSTLFALRVEKILIGVFLGLAILIAFFSIFMAMALFMAQKSKDFVLFRVLGLDPIQSKRMVTSMVWIFAGFGLIVGFITGISIVGLLYFKPLEVLPDIYYDTAISARLDHESVIFLFLGSITLIFVLARKLFSFFPSKMLAHYLKQY